MPEGIAKERLQNQLDVMVGQKQGLDMALQSAAANVNANDGAIQMLQYLIMQCDNGAAENVAPVTTEEKED